MAEKKIVDDYYGSINSSEKEEKENGAKKMKIKPKKIIKKIQKKQESENNSVSEEKKEVIEKNPIRKVIKKKPFVQTMSVVEKKKEERTENRSSNNRQTDRRDFKTRPNFNKKGDFKSRNNSNWGPNKQSSNNSWNNNSERKPFGARNNNFNKNKENTAFKKDDKKEFTIKQRGTGWQDNKNFWENKYKSSNNKPFVSKKKDDNSKKPNDRFSRGKTRGRFRFHTVDTGPKAFSRSNKINKKEKEEKKIEDIKQTLISKTWETVVMWNVFSLKEFSEKMWIPLIKLIAEFMKNGMMVNINSKIDFDSASIIAEAFEIKLEKDNSTWVSVKDLMTWNILDLLKEEDDSKLIERPPVVSIMWHVDHGKTSLLDQIRKSKVTDWEAWGITQSIWAYQVEHEWKKLTFLDTPWHEAFTVMRSRWARATDIAILVVAADEWVKPQTIESISHAKEAGIPVIVAINKMDKEGANPDHVKGQLSEHGLTPEDWGGDTPMVPVSAKSWFGIDDLLEILLLVAEMKELKANPDRAWVATVIESHLDTKLWPVATVLVNTWVINKWDNIVCNDSFWKIRTMKNYENLWVVKALPWDPILVIGLDKVVAGWDVLQVVANPNIARTKASEYSEIIANIKKNEISGLDVLMSRIKAWNLKQLKVLIKADTNWSLEAIKASVLKLSTEETNVVIIHSWVGNITEWDVLMVDSSEAILVWFNVNIIPSARNILDKSLSEYISSKVIYHITDRLEKIVSWMLDPKEVEVPLGMAKVWGIFYTDKDFMIVWLILKEGDKIEKNCLVRVIRKDKKIAEWKIPSLKQWIEEVKELEGPIECWVKFEWKWEILEWDIFEVYKIIIEK